MASQTEDVTAGQSPTTNQQSQITIQKSPMPRKPTGPRTAQGKRRSSQNARKHGLYSNVNFFWDAAIALGEDPRDFERLLKGLVLVRQPADTLEMVLVEDIALLVWKKARLDRAEAAVQVCNLQKHDLDRRKQFVQVGREISDTLQSEVRAKGLRRTLDAPGKFEQILSILDILVEMVEKNDFSPNMQEFLRGVYGEEPTLRGAGLYNNYFKLSEMEAGSQEFEDAKTLMRARLAEEISDVAQQYELFLLEHVENTRAARMAATAPSHAQWAVIIRQQNALHRQLQQKIRLLGEIQEKRKREEERFLDNCEASLRRNPSDAPRGGRQASNRKKILNRGNEPKTLLKQNELADTASSKQTPFCPEKSAIEAKKRGVSMQEATGDAHAPAAHRRAPAQAGAAQARLKIGEKAALPPGLRKAPGFPAQTASLLPLGSAGRPSLPAEPRGLVRAKALGKAKPFRISGGRAALRGYPSGTLTRPCRKADAICGAAVRPRMLRNSGRAKEQVCAARSPRSGLGCVIVSRLVEKPGVRIQEPGFRSQDSGVRRRCRIGRRARSSRWFTAFMLSWRPCALARLTTCWSRKASTTHACRRLLMPAGLTALACVLLPGRRWSARRVTRNIRTLWRCARLEPMTTSKLFWHIPRGPCSLSWTEWKTLPTWGPLCARRWQPVVRGL